MSAGETTSDPRMGLTEDEVDWLGGFLTSTQVPDTAMSLEMVDGFFTALIAGPDVVRPSAYLDAIWGGAEREAPAFDTKEQAEYVMGLLMRRWNAIAEGIMIGDPAPALIMDFGDTLTGQDWADGFLLGLDYHEVRRVKPQGVIKWRGEFVFIGEALAGELVGLAEQDNGSRIVRFAGRDLGAIDRAGRFLRFAPPRARLRSPQHPADDTPRASG